MFENLIRELERLQGTRRISVSVPSDTEGYLDRECPSPECEVQFKVHEDDWRSKVGDEEVFCAFCGHAARSQRWWTKEQVERTKLEALTKVERRLGGAMRRDAENWNARQSRNSLIRITMHVDNAPIHVFLPPAATSRCA
jgi:hypothetical protein